MAKKQLRHQRTDGRANGWTDGPTFVLLQLKQKFVIFRGVNGPYFVATKKWVSSIKKWALDPKTL